MKCKVDEKFFFVQFSYESEFCVFPVYFHTCNYGWCSMNSIDFAFFVRLVVSQELFIAWFYWIVGFIIGESNAEHNWRAKNGLSDRLKVASGFFRLNIMWKKKKANIFHILHNFQFSIRLKQLNWTMNEVQILPENYSALNQK